MQLRTDGEDSDGIEMDLEEGPDSDQSNDEEVAQREVQLRNHRLPLTCVVIDSKDEHAFTASKDGSIIKWCLKSRKILHKVNSIRRREAASDKKLEERYHVNHINAIAISSDDRFLATGGWDKKIRIWSPENLKWLHTFTLHRQEITTLAFRRGHHTLYSGSVDKSVMLWTLEDDDNRCFVDSLIGHESPIMSMDTSRRERVLTAGGLDQSLRVWKIVEQAQTVFQSSHGSADVARYINDQVFVSGGEDGSITIWTTMKRSPLSCVKVAHGVDSRTKLKNWITSLATFSLKSKKQKEAEKPTKRRKLDNDEVSAPNNQEDATSDEEDESDDESEVNEAEQQAEALVASGSCDSNLRVWKLIKNNLTLHQTFECPGFINELRFTSDGRRLVAACGSSHRFGRWTVKKGTKNVLRVFELDKIE